MHWDDATELLKVHSNSKWHKDEAIAARMAADKYSNLEWFLKAGRGVVDLYSCKDAMIPCACLYNNNEWCAPSYLFVGSCTFVMCKTSFLPVPRMQI